VAVYVIEDLVIPEGDVRTYQQNNDNGIASALMLGGTTSVFNYGSIYFDNPLTSTGIFINCHNSGGVIENYGLISAVTPDDSYVKAIYSGSWSSNVINHGDILAQARDYAVTVETWDPYFELFNGDGATISSQSAFNSITIYAANGGDLVNHGNIVATSTGGIGNIINACAISFSNGSGSVQNSGLIQATDNDPSTSYAVAISFYGYGQNEITNTGTIRGDYAIREINHSHYPDLSGAVVRNSGLIEGLIYLGDGNDLLVNSGHIDGDIGMGWDDDLVANVGTIDGNVILDDGRDIYDGRGGSQTGTVFGGAGGDLLIGGSGRDSLNGGIGNDVLVGGGGDTLTGGDGADHFMFTAITSGQVAESITDFVSGLDRIDLRSLSPTSVTLSGSTISVVTATGSLTIQVTGSVALSDIVTGATTELFGTAGDDTLVAGPGGSLLSGGEGHDFLIGGVGDDRLDGGTANLYNQIGDAMWGGAGDDTYVVYSSYDRVVELAGGGYDTIDLLAHNSGDFGYDLPDNIERVLGSNANGNTLDNAMIGDATANVYKGRGGNDLLDGGSGNDKLYGEDGADTLIGGSGNDLLMGGAGADFLTGGFGADRYQGSTADLSGDTIAELGVGDSIIISDAAFEGFTFSLSGNTLTFTGGSLTVQNMPVGYLVAKAAFPGGVEIKLVTADVQSDFNGDLRSDILWGSGGVVSNWLGTNNGGFTVNDANALNPQASDLAIAGVADFNGDGRDDILWRGVDGSLSVWTSDDTGGWPTFYDPYSGAGTGNGSPPRYQIAQIPLNWQVAGTGDFNGDGRDDILWRSDDGALSNWLSNGGGTFTINDGNAFSQVPTYWNVAGIGDFNGDGRDDILWRNVDGQISNWLGQANGGFVVNDANAFASVPTNWHIVGVGDFNGDTIDDILWRSDAGELSNWLATASGSFVINDANAFTTVPTSWHVVATGDYNGDGRDDILWRHTDGTLSNWLATASGGFTPNDANAATPVPISWHVQPEPFLL